MRLNKTAAYFAAQKNLDKRKKLLDKAVFAYEKAGKRLNKALNALSEEQRKELKITTEAEIKVNFGGIDVPVNELVEG